MKVEIAKVGVKVHQNSDSCDENPQGQTLELFTEDAGAGTYYVMKTDRWSFDSVEELIEVINDFIRRTK